MNEDRTVRGNDITTERATPASHRDVSEESDRHGAAAQTPVKVSIIIPFFNVEDYFAQCIESVVSQTHRHLEIILVDDGSSDTSRIVAERFARRDDRITLLTHGSNVGAGIARNTGVAQATGDYLFFLDSDDCFASATSLAVFVAVALERRVGITVSNCSTIADDEHETFLFDESVAPESQTQSLDALVGEEAFLACLRLTSRYLPMRTTCALFDADFYKETALAFCAFEHEDMAQSPFLYLKSPGGVVYLREPLVKYRIRPISLSHSKWSPARFERYLSLWLVFKERTRKFGVDEFCGDAAMDFVCHMLWRIDFRKAPHHLRAEAIRVAHRIMADVHHVSKPRIFFERMTSLRQSLGDAPESAVIFSAMTETLPRPLVSAYYSHVNELSFEGSEPAEFFIVEQLTTKIAKMRTQLDDAHAVRTRTEANMAQEAAGLRTRIEILDARIEVLDARLADRRNISLSNESIQRLATEVWFEKQRWGWPYKLSKWISGRLAHR